MPLEDLTAINLLTELKADNATWEWTVADADPGVTQASMAAAIIAGATFADAIWGTPTATATGAQMVNTNTPVVSIPGSPSPGTQALYWVVRNKANGQWRANGPLTQPHAFTEDGTLTAQPGSIVWRM